MAISELKWRPYIARLIVWNFPPEKFRTFDQTLGKSESWGGVWFVIQQRARMRLVNISEGEYEKLYFKTVVHTFK